MRGLMVLFLLALVPCAFAVDMNMPLRPIDIIWYMVAFCVFVILFILHHLMIQKKPVEKKRA